MLQPCGTEVAGDCVCRIYLCHSTSWSLKILEKKNSWTRDDWGNVFLSDSGPCVGCKCLNTSCKVSHTSGGIYGCGKEQLFFWEVFLFSLFFLSLLLFFFLRYTVCTFVKVYLCFEVPACITGDHDTNSKEVVLRHFLLRDDPYSGPLRVSGWEPAFHIEVLQDALCLLWGGRLISRGLAEA